MFNASLPSSDPKKKLKLVRGCGKMEPKHSKFQVSTNQEGKTRPETIWGTRFPVVSQNNSLLAFSTDVGCTKRLRRALKQVKKFPFCISFQPFAYSRLLSLQDPGGTKTRKPAVKSSLGFCARTRSPYLSINNRKD